MVAGLGTGSGKVSHSRYSPAFDPEDGVGVVRFEQELQVLADVRGALDEALGLIDVPYALKLRLEPLQGVCGVEVSVAVGLEEKLAFHVFEGHAT